MFSSLTIEGYRGFRKFSMSGLGRVNLLVGTNNSGKTSVLEAIYLLAFEGDPLAIWQILSRRGERLISSLPPDEERMPRRYPVELDISHLFVEHKFAQGASISISGDSGKGASKLGLRLVEVTTGNPDDLYDQTSDSRALKRLAIRVNAQRKVGTPFIYVSPSGGLSRDAIEVSDRRIMSREIGSLPASFITTESLSSSELITAWNQIALTPSENLIIQALQFLDPAIERIAPQLPSSRSLGANSRGGFIVKRRGIEHPIPIGSMGDGMWRMLSLAMAITQCKGGILIVDEIDTGLHYTVMAQMWNLIYQAAKEFDVQVFATTHSYDCVYSLAQIDTQGDANNRVTVQRIEQGRDRAVPYDEVEISAAASRSIEVR